ncbi:MAG: VirD4-like conjugal transfer protein, CD1115 family [Acutalibacter sp.]
MQPIAQLILAGGIMFGTLAVIAGLSGMYNLNIKAKTVGHGQHGTARWATKREIRRTYLHIPFEPELWRKGEHLPKEQGIVVGCQTDRHLPYNFFRVVRNLVVCRMHKHPGSPLPKPSTTTALVDTGDVHAIMIGAAGVGKTAYWLYPCLEYAMASGMSFLSTDTKGDVVRNYGRIAQEYYGYRVGVIDLRNPTRSDGFNLLHLVSKYMDAFQAHPDILLYKAKAERYAKIISKTIITAGMDGQNFGQNQFFYDAAEGLLTSTILLVAEFCPPTQRHIVSVFKIIQELMAPSQSKGQTQFQVLLSMLPDTHKAKWFAGAATSTADQAMASVMSTTLARLNAFLDSEMEQLLCFDTAVDAETFCKEKSALFLVMPEEDPSKFFMVSLIIQQLYREILAVADDNGGKLPNRAVFYADEFGTLPKIESAEMMFSASRSRRLSIVPIIQSLGQLEKNYGKEGAEIIVDNTQVTIFGGFAPNSETAQVMSKSLGSRTVQSGSVSKGKDSGSQSLQMIERPLMTPDELKSMPKGQFIVMKTGFYPMKVKLKLFFKWGITFEEPYVVPDKGNRPVAYAGKKELAKAIREKFPSPPRKKEKTPESKEIPPAQFDPREHLPQAVQGEQPATKVHASAPTRRKTPPGKEREDDRP